MGITPDKMGLNVTAGPNVRPDVYLPIRSLGPKTPHPVPLAGEAPTDAGTMPRQSGLLGMLPRSWNGC